MKFDKKNMNLSMESYDVRRLLNYINSCELLFASLSGILNVQFEEGLCAFMENFREDLLTLLHPYGELGSNCGYYTIEITNKYHSMID